MTTKQQFLVTIESNKPIESITDFIMQRLWSLEHKGARVLDITASLLREDMTVMITADLPGASIDNAQQIQKALQGVTLNMQQIAERAVATFDPQQQPQFASGGLVDPSGGAVARPLESFSGYVQQIGGVARPRYQEDPMHKAMDDTLDATLEVK